MRWVSIHMNKKKAFALAALVKEKGWSEEDVRRESDKLAVSIICDVEQIFRENEILINPLLPSSKI